MSKIRECFVCGCLLTLNERQRIEVRHRSDKVRTAEACARCWLKVHGSFGLRVERKGKVYEAKVRRSQPDLFARTAAVVTGKDGGHE